MPTDVEDLAYEIWFDRAPEQRGREFESLCTEYPTHAAALRELRAKLAHGDTALERVNSAEDAVSSPEIPDRIGPYEILEEIGAGGFGVVYRARQHEPVDRIVAIKVLHAERMHGRTLTRFENERQALALMDHPAIAHVFDAGSTPSGQPYFAMEFVEGAPITTWCDDHRLGIDERLGLFLRVCAALHHAHQKGVVHRDLKPSNVLVFEQDGRPVPKVIDFGIAKALDDTAARVSFATIEGGMVGTPEYMSPEQAAGRPVDTRTDVYALGVMLFELLTGELPFDRNRLQSGNLVDVARIVCDEEPRRPSSTLTKTGASADVVARNRGTVPRQLLRRLRTDLDWIVLKALEKDPAARYGSVGSLVLEVERHQQNRPIEARQHLFFYVARKFVRRHRVGVAIAALVLLMCVLGVAGLAWAGEEAARQRDRAVLNAYAASMAAAHMALESGAIGVAERRLADTEPRLRGWEWRYVKFLLADDEQRNQHET